MRVIVFFALLLTGFLAPVGGALLLALLGPSPYVLVGEGPGAEWRNERSFSDGSHALVRRYATEHAAARAARRDVEAIPTNFRNSTLDLTRYRRSDNDRHGLVLPISEYVVQIEAPNAEVVEARFQSLGFLRENPQKNPLWIALTEWLPATLATLGAYVFLLGMFMARGGAWAARIKPGAALPLPVSTLRDRLMDVNRLNVPFQITQVRPGRFIVEWRIVDAKWVGVMSAGGLRLTHRIHLDLDETDRTVRVLHSRNKTRWEIWPTRFIFKLLYFQGIAFTHIEHGVMVGLLYDKRSGWSIREGYNYRFDLAEMKAPFVEAVTQSGWTWQPVVTFFRLIGG